MASETIKKSSKKSKKRVVPTVQITLTTFCEDENGELSPTTTTENVKIDGEQQIDDIPKERDFDWSILHCVVVRNLLVLSLGQFLLFTAFDSLSNLQGTINGESGAVSLAVVYGVGAASSFLLPSAAVGWLGCKRTLVLSAVGFCPYVLANFHPAWPATLLPTAVVCGVACGLMLTARSTYVNRIGRRFAGQHRVSPHVTNAWFFSFCVTLQQNSEIWGNLLSYCVLRTTAARDGIQTVSDNCGPDFCDDGPPAGGPHWLASDRRYVLVTIYSALALVAVFFLAFFLDSLEESEESDETKKTLDRNVSFIDFLATFRQFSKLDQILLIPLSLYTGIVLGFYKGEYTKAYIACAWGVPHVAAVSICYGVVSVLVDSAGGPCVVTLGRSGLFLLAAIAHLAMFLALFLWKPDSRHTTGFFLVASASGIGNGVWMSQIAALYGVLFRESEEAAFSSFYFLHMAGFLLARACDYHPCTYSKLFVPPAALALGIVCYLAVEVRAARRALASADCKASRRLGEEG